MMHSFPELTIGGVLVAPFVIYAGAAIAIFAMTQFADCRIEPLRRDPRAAHRAILKELFLAPTKLRLTPTNNSGTRA
jgi:hypothetical protein